MYQNGYLGSGPYGEVTFLDLVTLLSFLVGMKNLEENLTQNDKQELEQAFNNKLNDILIEIHEHLETQDDKINKILDILEKEDYYASKSN